MTARRRLTENQLKRLESLILCDDPEKRKTLKHLMRNALNAIDVANPDLFEGELAFALIWYKNQKRLLESEDEFNEWMRAQAVACRQLRKWLGQALNASQLPMRDREAEFDRHWMEVSYRQLIREARSYGLIPYLRPLSKTKTTAEIIRKPEDTAKAVDCLIDILKRMPLSSKIALILSDPIFKEPSRRYRREKAGRPNTREQIKGVHEILKTAGVNGSETRKELLVAFGILPDRNRV
jgi:hypothetical protein